MITPRIHHRKAPSRSYDSPSPLCPPTPHKILTPFFQAKERLLGVISSFVQEKILFAGDHLAGEAAKRIQSDDVVLTYGYSSVVAAVLLRAAAAGTPFAVVVADARPLLEGRRMLRALLAARVPAQYVALNGLSFVLPRVTKVLLGAGAVLSNGAVLARAGSAAVAMAASAAHVPVLVAAETYKFHERVQLDSITHNELGDPDLLVEVSGTVAGLGGWRREWGGGEGRRRGNDAAAGWGLACVGKGRWPGGCAWGCQAGSGPACLSRAGCRSRTLPWGVERGCCVFEFLMRQRS